ncbi:MAG: hypothetical protein QNJ36_03930 [Calothrix sp. MO_167.B42]|nr:hypothetical protein [Calothrix sp. MO_167.B42]
MPSDIIKDISFEKINEITKTILIKEDLERLIKHHTNDRINFKEEYHEVIAVLENIKKIENVTEKGELLNEAQNKIRTITKKYANSILETTYETLEETANTLQQYSTLFIESSKIKEALKEDSKFKVLKQWTEWMELLAEIIENNKETLEYNEIIELKKLVEAIISVTFIKHKNETRKNKLKKELRYTASFILNIIESCKPENSWKLVIGKKTYEELLRESQAKIELIDDLEPTTEDELKQQIDTFEYLQEKLNWKID